MSDAKRLVQKLRQYRVMAAQAWKEAEDAATPELKHAHEEVARAWDELIKEIEALQREL